ncbi:MAG TPA: hypothetical protein VNF07_10285 [Acidimicrobiales bacterium]|nr:hypothetical protein [Acidimicrobiales bacterium]
MQTSQPTTRAEVVGSLLQPAVVLDARAEAAFGRLDEAELAAIEDEAVLAAIALQESVGLDVITDGEMRRPTWADVSRHLEGFEILPGERSYPANARLANPSEASTVVRKITPKSEHPVGEEFPFLAAHATARTKYTMAAPSYSRRYWSDQRSTSAYERVEDFLQDVRNYQREVASRLVAEGCDYLQLDAPNYGSLTDPETRAFHEARGHDIDAQVAFDAALDSSVFTGLEGVTRALHVCRGNMRGGAWHSSGGYGALADQLFSNLDVDVVLLEYDTDRAGDFAPIGAVREGTLVVLGLLTTKDGTLEDEAVVEARISEATHFRPMGELALSTQCGFASAANAPMSEAEQRAKLELVARVAHSLWS